LLDLGLLDYALRLGYRQWMSSRAGHVGYPDGHESVAASTEVAMLEALIGGNKMRMLAVRGRRSPKRKV